MKAVAGAVLALYAALVLFVQFFAPQRGNSLPQLFDRQAMLGTLTNELSRDSACIPLSGFCRNLDMALPENARVYISDMLGAENGSKCGYYYFLRYYLFPREVAIARVGTMRFTNNGYRGEPCGSDEQLKAAGYDVVVDFPANKNPSARAIRPLSPKLPAEASLLGGGEAVVALVLPFLAAFMGLRLLKFVLPALVARMGLWESVACGFGVGMMAVASLTLGVKLSGVLGIQVVPVVVVGLAGYELWASRRALWTWMRRDAGATLWHPVVPVLFLVLLLFGRLACLEGLIEFDAVAAWMTKAKIIFHSAGDNLVGYFSDPTLAHAHLDYPTLVPALHAATWGTLGHVNEFVTKCWPVWQLVFLLLGIGSVVNLHSARWGGPLYWLLALALLPVTVEYVRWEGATMPMVFFVAMGMIQIVIALQDEDRERLMLGGLLLVGAAMTKFEGMILCAAAVAGVVVGFAFVRRGWMRDCWKVVLLAVLLVGAFVWLRIHIPVLHFESLWLRDAYQHLGATLRHWPQMMVAIAGTSLFNAQYAVWSVVDGHLEWSGAWTGLGSLFNQPTLGLVWVALALTVAGWMAVPKSRRIMVWVVWVVLAALAFLSFVLSALGAATGLEKSLTWVSDSVSGRYLLPVLVAWASSIVCIVFRRSGVHVQSGKK